jgi:hypothetical protein
MDKNRHILKAVAGQDEFNHWFEQLCVCADANHDIPHYIDLAFCQDNRSELLTVTIEQVENLGNYLLAIAQDVRSTVLLESVRNL